MAAVKAFRLSDCGDLLNVQMLSAWLLQSPNTTYQQLHDGSIIVAPWSQVPLRWRRVDCEAKLGQRDLFLKQRARRIKNKSKALAQAL